MSRYVVLEPPPEDFRTEGALVGTGAGAPSDRAVFVRDGFSIWAFLFSVLWLLRHRLWLAAAATLALVVGLAFLDRVPGFGPAVPILEFLVGLLAGLEGASLRIAKMRRLGWSEAAAFHAEDRDEAEIIYYAGKPFAEESSAIVGKAVPPRLPADRQAAASTASGDPGSRGAEVAEPAKPLAPGIPPRPIVKPVHTDRFFDAARAR